MRKTKAVCHILPREPLTKKALAAIEKYASIKGEKLPFHYFMVRQVLQAERMRRSELYNWLDHKGYKWSSKSGLWTKAVKVTP